MKARASRDTLGKAIGNMVRVLKARPVHEWEECVVINVDDNGMTLIASNVEQRVNETIECDAQEHGAVMVNGKTLMALVGKMDSDSTIHLESNEKELRLKVGSQKARLTALPYDKFPSAFLMEEPNIIRMSSADLTTALIGVKYAVSQEQTRQILTGVFMEVHTGKLFTVGLDGYRMAAYREPCDHAEDGKYLLPRESADLVSSYTKGYDGDVCIKAVKGHMRFEIGNLTYDSILLSGEYVDWKNIVPKDFCAESLLSAKDMLSAAELASVATSTTYAIRIEISEDGIVMTANGDTSGMEQKIDAEVQMHGESIKSAYNAKYLSDTMKACMQDKILFKVAGETKPAVITPAQGNEFLMLILPVRVAV